MPPTINDPESSELAERVVIDTLGKDKLSKMRKVMPGEDFAWYLQDKRDALPLLVFKILM